MKPRIFAAEPVSEEVEAFIAEHCDYKIWREAGRIPFPRLCEEIAEAEGLMILGGRIDAEFLRHAPKLKVVSNISVGYNNFHIDAMKERGVVGTHTPHVLDDTVADLVIGLMLAAARRIPEMDRLVKEGRWRKGEFRSLFGVDVHHSVIGVIGLGRIGRAIVKRARFGFDMEVLYHNRNRLPEAERKYDAVYVSMDDIFIRSDFVVVMTPLTAQTEKMVGAAQLGLMKPSAVFINASRGPVVDEAALFDALRRKAIFGAGLDVFAKEPIAPDNPLLSLPNVVTLPHIGSATWKTRIGMEMRAAVNMVAALRGEVPPNLIPEMKSGADGA